MGTVYIFLAEGFEEIEALSVVDILRRAGISAKTVSVAGNNIVAGAHGISVVTDIVLRKLILQMLQCWFFRVECLGRPDLMLIKDYVT